MLVKKRGNWNCGFVSRLSMEKSPSPERLFYVLSVAILWSHTDKTLYLLICFMETHTGQSIGAICRQFRFLSHSIAKFLIGLQTNKVKKPKDSLFTAIKEQRKAANCNILEAGTDKRVFAWSQTGGQSVDTVRTDSGSGPCLVAAGCDIIRRENWTSFRNERFSQTTVNSVGVHIFTCCFYLHFMQRQRGFFFFGIVVLPVSSHSWKFTLTSEHCMCSVKLAEESRF